MKSLLIAALITLAAAPYAAHAAPAAPPQYVMHTQSQQKAFNALVVTSYHIAAGQSYAVLAAANASLPNGGAEPLTLQNRAITFLAGQNGSVKEGLVIPGNAQPLQINAGAGTAGFYIEKSTTAGKQVSFRNASAFFYGCPNANLPYGPAIQLGYAPGPLPLPSTCGEVDLFLTSIY